MPSSAVEVDVRSSSPSTTPNVAAASGDPAFNAVLIVASVACTLLAVALALLIFIVRLLRRVAAAAAAAAREDTARPTHHDDSGHVAVDSDGSDAGDADALLHPRTAPVRVLDTLAALLAGVAVPAAPAARRDGGGAPPHRRRWAQGGAEEVVRSPAVHSTRFLSRPSQQQRRCAGAAEARSGALDDDDDDDTQLPRRSNSAAAAHCADTASRAPTPPPPPPADAPTASPPMEHLDAAELCGLALRSQVSAGPRGKIDVGGDAALPAFVATTAKDVAVYTTTHDSRYRLLQRIGAGAFSSVYLVQHKTTGKRYALKYILCKDDRERQAALRECEVIHSLQGHPQVVRIVDMFMNYQFQQEPTSPTSSAGAARREAPPDALTRPPRASVAQRTGPSPAATPTSPPLWPVQQPAPRLTAAFVTPPSGVAGWVSVPLHGPRGAATAAGSSVARVDAAAAAVAAAADDRADGGRGSDVGGGDHRSPALQEQQLLSAADTERLLLDARRLHQQRQHQRQQQQQRRQQQQQQQQCTPASTTAASSRGPAVQHGSAPHASSSNRSSSGGGADHRLPHHSAVHQSIPVPASNAVATQLDSSSGAAGMARVATHAGHRTPPPPPPPAISTSQMDEDRCSGVDGGTPTPACRRGDDNTSIEQRSKSCDTRSSSSSSGGSQEEPVQPILRILVPPPSYMQPPAPSTASLVPDTTITTVTDATSTRIGAPSPHDRADGGGAAAAAAAAAAVVVTRYPNFFPVGTAAASTAPTTTTSWSYRGAAEGTRPVAPPRLYGALSSASASASTPVGVGDTARTAGVSPSPQHQVRSSYAPQHQQQQQQQCFANTPAPPLVASTAANDGVAASLPPVLPATMSGVSAGGLARHPLTGSYVNPYIDTTGDHAVAPVVSRTSYAPGSGLHPNGALLHRGTGAATAELAATAVPRNTYAPLRYGNLIQPIAAAAPQRTPPPPVLPSTTAAIDGGAAISSGRLSVSAAIRAARAGQQGERMHLNDGKPHVRVPSPVTDTALQPLLLPRPSPPPPPPPPAATGTGVRASDADVAAPPHALATTTAAAAAAAAAPLKPLYTNLGVLLADPDTSESGWHTATAAPGPGSVRYTNVGNPQLWNTYSADVTQMDAASAAAVAALTGASPKLGAAGPRAVGSGAGRQATAAAAAAGTATRSSCSSSGSAISPVHPQDVRDTGYLCLVMAYHAMGDLCQYTLRVKKEVERCHQHVRQAPSHGGGGGDAGSAAGQSSARSPATATTDGTRSVSEHSFGHPQQQQQQQQQQLLQAHGYRGGIDGAEAPASSASARPLPPSHLERGRCAVEAASTSVLAAAAAAPLVLSRQHVHPTLATGGAVPLSHDAEADAAAAPADPTWSNPLTEPQLLSIAYQIASVLNHMHCQSPPIIHRDLKPENILIKGEPRDYLDVPVTAAASASTTSAPASPVSPTAPHSSAGRATSTITSTTTSAPPIRIRRAIVPIVVTDFGLAVLQDVHGRPHRGRGGGTRPYIAPESWHGGTCTASDVWGLGCVLYALATCRLVAGSVRIMSDEARQDGFASRMLNDILANRYSLAFASFVVSLLVVDPAKRPTAAQAAQCFYAAEDEVRFDFGCSFFTNVLDL